MEEFISFIAKHLVTDPDAVSVEKTEKDGGIVYRLHVGDGDLGQVIGKEGRTAKSLRILLIAAAARAGQRARLEIVDPAKEGNAPPQP
ncbi:MAG: KH domain-containing protein [bacterium]